MENLDASETEAIMIGYLSGSGGYKIRDRAKQKAVVSRDVHF